MTKKTLLLVVLCAFYLGEAKTMNSIPIAFVEREMDMPPGYDEIVLLGDLMTNVNPNAIEAGVGENDIYIHFNQNLETVSIYLYYE